MTTTSENSQGMTPAKRPGAPNGNANRRKHGARGRLTLSRAVHGDGADKYRHEVVGKLRAKLEADIATIHGSVDLYREARILTVCRAELCIKTFEAWGRKPGRTEQERLEVAEKVLDFSDRRDKALRELLGEATETPSADPQARLRAALATAKANENGHAVAITEGQP
jgi:hypothetical protein